MTTPNEDIYIVEDGSLLMVASRKHGIHAKDPQNLLKFGPKIPKRDWDIKATVKCDARTGLGSLWFGMFKDTDDYMGIHCNY